MNSASPTPTGAIHMASIDWLTATAKSPIGRAEFAKLGAIIGGTQERLGNDVKIFGWQGYVGRQCGEMTWGERNDSAILRLSGPLAAGYWRDVMTWADNASRVDLQVTVGFSRFPKHLALTAYNELCQQFPDEAQRPNFDLRLQSKGGETLYLGKGASDKYARLYNKDAESNDPAYRNCWRYEIELKNKAAKSALQRLRETASESPLIATYVWRHFADRSVVPTFAPSVGDGLLDIPRSRSTDERRLAWLGTQVRACVQELLSRGKGQQVRSALGF